MRQRGRSYLPHSGRKLPHDSQESNWLHFIDPLRLPGQPQGPGLHDLHGDGGEGPGGSRSQVPDAGGDGGSVRNRKTMTEEGAVKKHKRVFHSPSDIKPLRALRYTPFGGAIYLRRDIPCGMRGLYIISHGRAADIYRVSTKAEIYRAAERYIAKNTFFRAINREQDFFRRSQPEKSPVLFTFV